MTRPVGCAARTILCLFLLPFPAFASPFVNVTPHPELAALRPVTAAPVAVSAPADPLPALVLHFVPETTEAARLPSRPAFANLWDRIRAGFGMADLGTPAARAAEAWYASKPELVTRILERSRPYLFHIVEEVQKRGMPTELALLPFVESGFDPFALSPAQALGLWQFIPQTATKYRLARNEVFDARRDVIASTTAALDYLEFLHGLFGDWQLALAAYNWGENQVARAIERNRARGLGTDYASLVLPAETRQYVPKLLAVKRLVMDQVRFRIALPAVPNRPYFTAVPRAATVDLVHMARLAEMEVGEFKALNAAHGESIINASATVPLVVPADRAQSFVERLNDFLEKEEARLRLREGKRVRGASPAKVRPSRRM